MSFGSKKQDVPKVKSIGELTTEGTQANIAQLPLIIEAMNKYGPDFAAALLKTNYGSNPALKGLGELLSSRLEDAKSGGIPQYLKDAFTQNLRGAQAIRGFADSPISAAQEGFGLAGIADASINNTINSAIDFSNLDATSVSLEDLGLNLPGIGDQTGKAQEQNISQIQAAQDEYNLKRSDRKAKGSLVGGIVGGIGGSFLGDPVSGAAVGSSIGGTFF